MSYLSSHFPKALQAHHNIASFDFLESEKPDQLSWVVETQNVVCLKEEAYSWVVVEVVGMQEEVFGV
jgi:hypothetical protein